MTFFGVDVRKKFEGIKTQLENDTKGGAMVDEQARDNELSMRVYRLTQTYVNLRTEEKSGKKYKEFSRQKDSGGRILYPQEYREAREKVCSDAFLAMRGRRDQEFVEYFTGTICSVPQYLSQEEYIAVARALMTDWERIKILSMLALSAHSYLSSNTENEEVK
jgi:CRISPR-associated protein Cmx8